MGMDQLFLKMKDDNFHQNNVLLDVRTADEFKAFRIEGSVNCSHDLLDQNWTELSKEIKSDSCLIIYCRMGVRAGYALEFLKSKNLDQDIIVCNQDGMAHWADMKYPLLGEQIT